MDNHELRQLLHRLHDEIERIRTGDEKSVIILRDMHGDIHALLNHLEEQARPIQAAPPQEAPDHPALVQRLDDAICHFEVSHPSLTTMLSKLLDTLSNAGI